MVEMPEMHLSFIKTNYPPCGSCFLGSCAMCSYFCARITVILSIIVIISSIMYEYVISLIVQNISR